MWFVCSQSEKVGGEAVKQFISGINTLEGCGGESKGARYRNVEGTASIKQNCLFRQYNLIREVQIDEDCLRNKINSIIKLKVEIVPA